MLAFKNRSKISTTVEEQLELRLELTPSEEKAKKLFQISDLLRRSIRYAYEHRSMFTKPPVTYSCERYGVRSVAAFVEIRVPAGTFHFRLKKRGPKVEAEFEVPYNKGFVKESINPCPWDQPVALVSFVENCICEVQQELKRS